MVVADWPVTQAADFTAAYVFDEITLSTVSESAPTTAQVGIAESHLSLWGKLTGAQSPVTMVAQTSEHCTVVSRHGNMIVQGRNGLNLGLVFASLAKLPLRDTRTGPADILDFTDHELRVFWRIINAVGRCEFPRTIILDAGGYTTALYAASDGFAFVDKSQDLDTLVGSVRAALAAGQPVRYTLEDMAAPIMVEHRLSDLLIAINGPTADDQHTWLFDKQNWPICCPQDTTLQSLEAAVVTAQALAEHVPPQGDLKVTLYGADRQIESVWLANPEGTSGSIVEAR